MDTKVKPQPQTDVFNSLENQELRTIFEQSGIYIRGAIEDYEIDGQKGRTGFVQLLVMTRPDSKRLQLKTIKVKEEAYGLIDILNRSKAFQNVTLACELVEYGKRSNTFLLQEQRHLKAA